ncbi:PTS sugar transporter subunit IIA [Gracilibacillus sp. YIM 98692]|uniref:PTS sugar transporter subunit IIA n=1 Tax=Gracilibacillus sp. YIM 98692 TaxID=2663532 RepID=UPI0013D332FF|nr:PTS sugar transporter subunit IIA [Gracilibacillus sp. YIM 98692]
MKGFNEYVKEDLIFCDVCYESKEDFFEQLSNVLREKGYVKEGFARSIKERERRYPTGLDANPYQVAIPHTDPKHVVEPFIAVVKPREALVFQAMGSDDKVVEAEFLFVLGITEPTKQVSLLQNVIQLFLDKETMDALLQLDQESAIYQLLKDKINRGGVCS